MATTAYTSNRGDNRANESTLFSRSVALNWELVAYLVVFGLALFTRFYMLGDRTMSHDESLHTVFSNNLFARGDYQHNPMMHGPILFHLTALSYALFGVNDFSARVYPALVGVMVVMSPLLLRRWLGRSGTLLAMVMLLLSPLMLYYSRYIRHDMPSIMSALLMFWAAMMYISGPKTVQRKAYWLYIIAAAMLWNLGSKETAFIYIAIFGLFLTIYWLVRVFQHAFRFNAKMLFYTLNMGILLAGVMALAMIVVIAITFEGISLSNPFTTAQQESALPGVLYGTEALDDWRNAWNDLYDVDLNGQLDSSLSARAAYTGDQLGDLVSGDDISTPFATFLAWTGMTFVFIVGLIIGTALWAYRHVRFQANLIWITLDVLVLVALSALVVYLTDEWSHTSIINRFGETEIISTAAAALGASLALAGSLLMLYGVFRLPSGRFFLRHLMLLLVLVLAITSVLIVIEELSHAPSRTSTTEVVEQPVPGVTDVAGESVDVVQTNFKEYPLVMVWAIAAISVAGIVYTKAIGWWRQLRHFPEFDVLMVMGSLILPWLAAVFIVEMDTSITDWNRIGASLGWLMDILPVRGVEDPTTGLNTAGIQQTGQFVVGFLVFVPMALVSIVAGLAWNWRRWLMAALVFHVLFALFFTTVFTNIHGLASGMIYSLQYWMEQQGVRRGSQPQYYYTNVIMPIYEYLPIIGSVLAMIAGTIFFWRKQRELDDERRPVGANGGIYGLFVPAGMSADDNRDADNIDEMTAFNDDIVDDDRREPLPLDDVAYEGDVANLAHEDDLLLESQSFDTDPLFDDDVDDSSPDFETLDEAPGRSVPLWSLVFLSFISVSFLGLALVNGFLRPNEMFNFVRFIEIGINDPVGPLRGLGPASLEWRVNSGLLVLASSVAFLAATATAIAVYVLYAWPLRRELNWRYGPVDMTTPPEIDATPADRKWRLDYVPFLLFVAFWAIANLLGYTLAGEKMPWLGTHLTVPMILLAAWFFGRVIDRINWRQIAENGWIYLLVLPLLLIGLVQMILPFFGGQPPFQGTTSRELEYTYNWLAALVLFAGSLAGVVWLAQNHTGWMQVRRLFALVTFGILAAMTFRTAWVANYINHDLATEFLVYAHAGPDNKAVIEELTELSIRTTGGLDMRIMHDNRFAWPGSWYLRDFQDANSVIYIASGTPTLQQLEDVTAVIVGDENLSKVEPLVEDTFQQFQFKRMWWPMQEYFGLTAERINDLFDFEDSLAGQRRHGIFDIWWRRDYQRYEDALIAADPDNPFPRDFSLTGWPVSDEMYVFIRKDVAAQVWPYGVGDSQVLNPFTNVEPNICLENQQVISAEIMFSDTTQPFARPLGMHVSDDGRVFIANESEFVSRISVYSTDGRLLNTFGQPGTPADRGAFFTRPHSVTVADNGTVYVVDTWNYMVRALNSSYDLIDFWGQPDTRGFEVTTDPVDGFWGPRDIAIGPNGNVYVSDTGNKRIRVYSADGTWIRDFGRGGAGDGELNEPAGIVVHPDGRLFVADTWNQRIAVFDTMTGAFLTNYAIRGWRDDQAPNRPYLALDVERNLLYVTDPDVGRVLVLDTDGNCVGSFGSFAEVDPDMTQFGVIGGIATDSDGNVYVSDMTFNRVLRFPPFTFSAESSEANDGEDSGVIELIPPPEETVDTMPETTDDVSGN